MENPERRLFTSAFAFLAPPPRCSPDVFVQAWVESEWVCVCLDRNHEASPTGPLPFQTYSSMLCRTQMGPKRQLLPAASHKHAPNSCSKL